MPKRHFWSELGSALFGSHQSKSSADVLASRANLWNWTPINLSIINNNNEITGGRPPRRTMPAERRNASAGAEYIVFINIIQLLPLYFEYNFLIALRHTSVVSRSHDHHYYFRLISHRRVSDSQIYGEWQTLNLLPAYAVCDSLKADLLHHFIMH